MSLTGVQNTANYKQNLASNLTWSNQKETLTSNLSLEHVLRRVENSSYILLNKHWPKLWMLNIYTLLNTIIQTLHVPSNRKGNQSCLIFQIIESSFKIIVSNNADFHLLLNIPQNTFQIKYQKIWGSPFVCNIS